MKTNVAEIKAKLSEFLDRAQAGERIVICRHNAPVAELRGLDATRVEPRPIGPLPGRPTFDVSPSFFEPLPDDEIDLWEGVATTAQSLSRPRASASHIAKDRSTVKRTTGRLARRRRS